MKAITRTKGKTTQPLCTSTQKDSKWTVTITSWMLNSTATGQRLISIRVRCKASLIKNNSCQMHLLHRFDNKLLKQIPIFITNELLDLLIFFAVIDVKKSNKGIFLSQVCLWWSMFPCFLGICWLPIIPPQARLSTHKESLASEFSKI